MKLKTLREYNGLSQQEVSLIVGCTQGFISHLELGRCKPSKKMQCQLAAIYEIPMELLFDREKGGVSPVEKSSA
jgi:transcriptional regulator with XRE-family HTH domain